VNKIIIATPKKLSAICSSIACGVLVIACVWESKYEKIGRAAKSEMPHCDPAGPVIWNMVQKNSPIRDTARQI
jgi:hypothetical protein